MIVNKDLFRQLKTIKVWLYSSFILQWISGLGIIFQAYFLAKIVDQIFINKKYNIHDSAILLVFIILIRYILQILAQTFAAHGAMQIKSQLRMQLIDKIEILGPEWVHARGSAKISSIVVEGIENIDVFYSKYLPQLMHAVLLPLTILFFVFPIDLLTGSVFFITAPLIPILMILIGKWAESLTKKQWQLLQYLSGFFADFLKGIPTLRIFGATGNQLNYIRQLSSEYRQTTMGVLRIAFLSALSLELLATLSTAIVAVEIGLRLLYHGIDFHKAFFILLLAPDFYMPLRNLATQFHSAKNSSQAAIDIFQILKENKQPEQNLNFLESKFVTNARAIEKFSNPESGIDIKFQNVSFHYPEQNSYALRDISFEIKRGQKIAIIGHTGSGKSTLVKLMMQLFLPNKGKILFNDLDYIHLKQFELYQQMNYVPQNPYFFHGTIRDNLLLAKSDATDGELLSAMDFSQSSEFVANLPNGLDTIIGEEGFTLSMGQKQRLSVARAFLKKGSIFILDEPISFLDQENVLFLQKSIESLAENRTLVVIAHHLELIQNFDQIIYMKQGKIIQMADHKSLLKNCKEYAMMFDKHGVL